MSTVTNTLDVNSSFHKLVRAGLATVQTRINTRLSESYTLTYYPNQKPEAHPSLTSRFFVYGGKATSRHRLYNMLQLEIRTQNQYPQERERLAILMASELDDVLGLKTKRSAFYSYFNVLDYLASGGSATTQQTARLEPLGGGGWEPIPDENDQSVFCLITDFQIFYR